MKWFHAVLAACAALALACGASAQEKVQLEYKLKLGMELVYKYSGSGRVASLGDQQEKAHLAFSGTERYVVGEVDEKTGVMLIGQAPDLKMKITENANGAPGANKNVENFDTDMVSACRMDRAGNPVPRKPKDADHPRPADARRVFMMDHLQFDPAALPAGPVAVGATWESATDAPLHGFPAPWPAKLTSTLAEIKVVDGHKCAVITSKLSTGEQPANGRGSQMALTGEIETLFDLEGGFSRSVNTKLEINAVGGGEAIEVETSSALDSAKALPAEEAARTVKLIRALDEVGESVAGGEYSKAAEALDKLKDADPPEAWKAGIEKTAARVKQLADMAMRRPGMAPPVALPPVPAEQLFADGQKAMEDQNWAEAVARFKKLAEKYPTSALTPDALAAAIAICENRLNDQKTADELRKKEAALKANK